MITMTDVKARPTPSINYMIEVAAISECVSARWSLGPRGALLPRTSPEYHRELSRKSDAVAQ